MEKIKIAYPIIVEGKYDKIKLDSLVDADVFTTDGFAVFSSEEKVSLFRALAKKREKIIILTDSDGGGTLIRSHLKSVLPPDKIINLYTPEIKGKEKRKRAPSKAGTLGVEGTESEIIIKLLSPFSSEGHVTGGGITKVTLFNYGLTGSENSSFLREKLSKSLGFPKKMSPNALLSALNVLYTEGELKEILEKL